MTTIDSTACHIREVAYLLDLVACDRCEQVAERYSTAERTAIDIDLDHPVLLPVTVRVHSCAACQHSLRAQPPFVRPDAVYTNRVVTKAVDSVFRDRMAMRCVPDRLARDFWVRPSESLIRHWCRADREQFDFATDYQPWVVREFSGILCVDEVYQGDLALLLAVDPAASDGDRLVGSPLIQGNVDGTKVEAFLAEVRLMGMLPDQVIPDGSPLDPTVLAKVWPTAAHQLCLFHETRRVTRAVVAVIQQVRKSIPAPPRPPPVRAWPGVLPDRPPSEDPGDAATQRWPARHDLRQAARAQVHAPAGPDLSQRAIARQMDIHRQTVQGWLRLNPSETLLPELADEVREGAVLDGATQRRLARHAKREQVRELAAQGLSASEIGRRVGIHHITVKAWLQRPDASEVPVAPGPRSIPEETGRAAEGAAAVVPDEAAAPAPHAEEREPPPTPWASWDEVRQTRELLWKHRFLFVTPPEHLTLEETHLLTTLVTSPVGPPLQTARSFLLDWFALWRDETGHRRALEEARTRSLTWSTDPTSAQVPALQSIQAKLSLSFFDRLSPF